MALDKEDRDFILGLFDGLKIDVEAVRADATRAAEAYRADLVGLKVDVASFRSDLGALRMSVQAVRDQLDVIDSNVASLLKMHPMVGRSESTSDLVADAGED